MSAYPLDLNAPGALDALLAAHRAHFGDMRMEADPNAGNGSGDPAGTSQASPVTFKDPDTGESYAFPAATPLAEMKPEQVAEYWRHKARKHEDTVKARGDYDELKAKAAEADKLRKDQETASDKAVREAREQAATEERAKNAPRLVGAEFRAAAKGVLTAEQTTALLEDLDLTKYLTDTGEVDAAKVEKKVTAFAPAKDDGKGKDRFPDLGQGRRESKPTAGVASGKEMFQARRGSKAAS